MILRKPDFYDKFKCTASKCTDTCCIGWEIDIDKDSQEVYRKVAGTFGDKLRANIEDGHFKLQAKDRCPFLNKNNLCEIYENLGEDALCDICSEHPRFVEVYGDIMERGIGLCCEEAARLLFADEGPLQFISSEIDEPEDELDEDDIEIRDQVLYERDVYLKTLANSGMPLHNKLYQVFGYTDEKLYTPFESAEAMVEKLSQTISYGPAWNEALARIQASLKNYAEGSSEKCGATLRDQGYFSESDSIRLLAYLIYRHYAKCLFEGREQGKQKFALFFWNIARFFTRELAGESVDALSSAESAMRIKINAVKILSKQLEYCEENMKLIETALDD